MLMRGYVSANPPRVHRCDVWRAILAVFKERA
jgi:hypothetical protein